MHLEWVEILRAQLRDCLSERLVSISGVHRVRIRGWLLLHPVVQRGLVRQGIAAGPCHIQGLHSLVGIELGIGHHANEIVPNNHLRITRKIRNRIVIDVGHSSAHARRPDNLAVQHSG